MPSFSLAPLRFIISTFIAALIISSAVNVSAQEPLRLKQLTLERFGTITLGWPVTTEWAPQLIILFTKTETISESKNIAQALAHAGALVASLD